MTKVTLLRWVFNFIFFIIKFLITIYFLSQLQLQQQRLLQNVTDEDERSKRKFESHSLPFWKAPQSNSLQNLMDETHYQSTVHASNVSSGKKQRRKNSTSVSTRRLEGGSLPVDMHHSSAIQSPPDQPFLSELKNNKKRKEKQLQLQQQAKETVIDIVDNETDERKSYQRCLLDSKDVRMQLQCTHVNKK